MRHNYWAHTLEPRSTTNEIPGGYASESTQRTHGACVCNCWGLGSATREATALRSPHTRVRQQPLQTTATESPRTATKVQGNQRKTTTSKRKTLSKSSPNLLTQRGLPRKRKDIPRGLLAVEVNVYEQTHNRVGDRRQWWSQINKQKMYAEMSCIRAISLIRK